MWSSWFTRCGRVARSSSQRWCTRVLVVEQERMRDAKEGCIIKLRRDASSGSGPVCRAENFTAGRTLCLLAHTYPLRLGVVVRAEGVGPDYSAVQRNLALEIVRVTEAAALASGRWLGRGDKEAADQVCACVLLSLESLDAHRERGGLLSRGCVLVRLAGLPNPRLVFLLPQAAVDMMRKVLNGVRMDGVVVIGEGEKDEVREARMHGEKCSSRKLL
eukprot:scaffold183232_cov20-Tisochrysis_lutea.AAC.3